MAKKASDGGHTASPSRTRHRVRRTQKNLRRALVADACEGGITLVLGAGVSMSRGLSPWGGLVRALWPRVNGKRPLPAWLEGDIEAPHALAFQMVFEELEERLRDDVVKQAREHSTGRDPIPLARKRFHELLTEELYRGYHPRGEDADTLSVLADVVLREQARDRPRVRRVITFNADSLLEEEVNGEGGSTAEPVLWPVPRASFHPRRSKGAGGRAPLTIYHLHGYLPRKGSPRAAPDTLVFTDSQYWRSVASPGSFANRVFSHALQDSHCVFVGLSMEDVNIMRWLGLRRVEVEDDYLARQESQGIPEAKQLARIRSALDRHYWISTEAVDPSHILASHLERRGVGTVRLPHWGAPFEELMGECFPP